MIYKGYLGCHFDYLGHSRVNACKIVKCVLCYKLREEISIRSVPSNHCNIKIFNSIEHIVINLLSYIEFKVFGLLYLV